MSLLTDRDYLLHTLQLAYIRHVLPNHAPNSSRSGTGPYNLINFPVHSPAGADPSLSPYIALSGLADEQAWPELASGRNSPPLGLTLARERSTGSAAGTERGNGSGDPGGATARTRRGGPGLLGYTQTIVGKGGGVGGAGMRVGGKQRSWKGKGKMVIPENEADEVEGGPSELTTEALERRDSFENNLHQHRFARQPSNLVPPMPGPLVPPPVVIHSPVRTPRDSPSSPTRSMAPSAGLSLADLHASPPHPAPSESTATAATAIERRPRFAASTTEYHTYHSASPSPSRASSVSDFPSRPLSQLTEASSQGADAGPSAPASPLSLSRSTSPSPEAPPPLSLSQADPPSEPHSLPQHADTSISLTSSSPLRSSSPSPAPSLSSSAPQDSEPPQITPSSDYPAGSISVASSGVSLFGTSRHDRSAGLDGGGDETDPDVSKAPELSDSEGSPALPSPPPPAPAPVVPAFKLPPGIRVRERRRVNIRPGAGGMLLPPSLVAAAKAGAGGLGSIKEPERGEEHDHEHEHEHEELEVRNEKKEDEQEDDYEHEELEARNEKKAEKKDKKQEEGSPKADSGTSTAAGRIRSNTDPMLSRPSAVAGEEAATAAEEEAARPGIETWHRSEGSTTQASPRSRQISAPPAVPSGAPQPQTQPGSGKEQHLAPPPPSPRRREDSSPVLVFPKRSTYILSPPSPAPLAPLKRSALAALLTGPASRTPSSNPFSTLYASCISRSASSSDTLTLKLYFPHSTKPGASKPLTVGVKRDVTVEEVIGVGLWAYWEGQEKGEREPRLEVEEEKAESGEETTKWNLRIVEEDGEVDEDFPALDRVRAISAFSFNEFAIVKATGQQIKDNAAKQTTITRRPSRILSAPNRGLPAPVAATTGATLAPPQPADVPSAQLADSFRPGSTAVGTMGVSSALAVPVLLKVQLPPAPGISVNTTVQVPSDMYLVDVLEHICRKRAIENAKDWALIVRLSDGDVVVPLDRTVESLGDQHELVLVPRSQVGTVGLRQRNPRNINPSASIFKRLSEPPQPKYQSASQLTSTYQLYHVQRKLPMSLGGRHPRTIAIDGDYLHFMPSDGKAPLADSGGRTSSFHISLVHSCKVSRRSASSFKIVVHTKNRVDKRYDFEAESAMQAAEIVAAVRSVMDAWSREQQAFGRRGR
ncbi:hypothetical protein JCM21900_002188 [Sporobolomyces salmonicolor]